MIELILYSLLLLIIQIMAHYPLNLQHVQFFLSNRHNEIEYSEVTLRIRRAASNLQETLPIFITLMLLGILQDVDLTSLGTYWLLLRVIFFGLYAAGIEKIRSVVWILALIVLITMANLILTST
tara:strand:+ start:946 stop:1317 length:372 start_codon:yes stop_codon:yes gene_type:complete